MLNDTALRQQLPHVLSSTNLGFLGDRYQGKVRDNYSVGTSRVLVTTDRLSCFDVVVTSIPFKGQVLNQLAVYWLNATKSIVPNHLLAVPDSNVVVGRQADVLPVEVVVRAYLAGSAWRDYSAGKLLSGVKVPAGLKMSERLSAPIITPSTKAAHGSHDMPISEAEVLSQGLVERKLWEKIRETALALFELGRAEVAKRGLLLVDTKYEFGLVDGKLTLVDELHTLDSSRFWVESSYDQRFKAGQNPEMLDKEPTRQWLLERGYKGDGPVPEFTDDHRVAIARHYIDAYAKICGQAFEGEVGPVEPRIESNLRRWQLESSKALPIGW